jgi:pimeloyl-ACP methyl ester carboxylesterase
VKRKRLATTLACILFVGLPAAVQAASPAPGLYLDTSGAKVYVATQHELPDPAYSQYLNVSSNTTVALSHNHRLVKLCAVHEERRIVGSPLGSLGASLFYAATIARSTILLIHGSDAETREMGWIVPYFACNGVNVITYDQRGTGDSSGNWLANGPQQRATDADAIYDSFSNASACGDLATAGGPHRSLPWIARSRS